MVLLDQVLSDTDASYDKDLIFTLVIGGKLAHIGKYLVAFFKFYNEELNHEYVHIHNLLIKEKNGISNWSPNSQKLGHHQKLQKMLYMRFD